MVVINTLAYYNMATIKVAKRFIDEAEDSRLSLNVSLLNTRKKEKRFLNCSLSFRISLISFILFLHENGNC
jgi:hypothetical protein